MDRVTDGGSVVSVLWFGTGEMTRVLLSCVDRAKLVIHAFIDERPHMRGTNYAGAQVQDFASIPGYSFDYILIACGLSEVIADRLIKAGVPSGKIISLNFKAVLKATSSTSEPGGAKSAIMKYLARFPGMEECFDVSTILHTSWMGGGGDNTPQASDDIETEATKRQRNCSLDELFIKHTGDVYPCCRVWNKNDKRIGNIQDSDILNKIYNYTTQCECVSYSFQNDGLRKFRRIYIEFSLKCNAGCAMCAVYAPFWKGTYNLYDRLSEFIGETTPDIITVQGGEVLIQKKTMNFLLDQKNKNTTMRFNLITNGNVKGKIIEKAKKLFTAMTISIVGFQEQTYKTIMSLDIDTVKHFAEEIIKNSNIEINLKFLVTPLNIHEMCLFLDWALPLRPKSVQLVNADIAGYINVSTPISYWNVVFSHTGKELMSYLRNNQQQFSAHTIRLYYSQSLFRLLKIKLDDLNEMKVAGLLLPAG